MGYHYLPCLNACSIHRDDVPVQELGSFNLTGSTTAAEEANSQTAQAQDGTSRFRHRTCGPIQLNVGTIHVIPLGAMLVIINSRFVSAARGIPEVEFNILTAGQSVKTETRSDIPNQILNDWFCRVTVKIVLRAHLRVADVQ